jgi:hypothetical protein
MNAHATPALGPASRRLRAVALVGELGPLLAVFTLLLDDHGISPAQVSTIFTLWAVIGVALEVPSGALADRVDRRKLLAGVLTLRAMGIATWLVWPTYAGALLGASLWALHTTATSGTWEALVHDLLSARGRADDYAVVMARLGQLEHAGTALGALSAAGLLAAGASLVTLGWITVALQVVPFVAILSLPAVAAADDDDEDEDEEPGGGSWWGTMREGVRAALGRRALLTIVVAAGLLEGLFVLDEYVPLMARARGASDEVAPVLVLAVWAGLIVGGELAARRPGMGARGLGALLAVAAAAAIAAAASAQVWAVALIGVSYAAMNAAWILLDARLQERAPAKTRATVRSVVAFFAGVLMSGVFLVVGAMAAGADPSPGLVLVGGAILLNAALVWRWA